MKYIIDIQEVEEKKETWLLRMLGVNRASILHFRRSWRTLINETKFFM